MADSPATPLDAASLLIMRDSPRGLELYMVRRHPSNRFMANALVFVGGKLDEADASDEMLACCTGLAPKQAASRLGMAEPARAAGLYVTAIRECFEECGLLLARRPAGEPPLSSDELAGMRGGLLEGSASLLELCRRHRLQLPLDELCFLEHWITPEIELRRFDARFFICRAPAEQAASIDPRETTFGDWFSVEGVLQEQRDGRQLLAPPTLTILERLRRFSRLADLVSTAADRQPIVHMPRLLQGASSVVLLLPGDHRYEDPASPAGPEHYVTLEGGLWRRVCSFER